MHSRNKGNVAEREVAALIQTWWRQLEPECQVCRTPSSGGWGTPELRGSFRVAGDLATDAKKFPFAIEVKRRERWHLGNFVTGKPSPVWGWWSQCQVAAAEMNAIPMLWVRRSREPWIVVLPTWLAVPYLNLPDFYADPPPGAGRGVPVGGYLATRLLAGTKRDLRCFLRVRVPSTIPVATG